MQALTRLTALLDEPTFKDQILNAVTESLLYTEVEAPDDPEPRMLDVRDVQIDAVEEVRDIEIDEAYEDGDLLAFNIGGTLVAEADFYPFKLGGLGAGRREDSRGASHPPGPRLRLRLELAVA